MKKIFTIAAATVLFAANVASASNMTGGKMIISFHTQSAEVHYTKISAKQFSVKNMQDTKDILFQITPAASVSTTTTTAFAGR